MSIALNEDITGRLDEVARILAEQGANRFRVQCTVITSEFGRLKGLRIVRGREDECEAHYCKLGRLRSRPPNLVSSVPESNE